MNKESMNFIVKMLDTCRILIEKRRAIAHNYYQLPLFPIQRKSSLERGEEEKNMLFTSTRPSKHEKESVEWLFKKESNT